MPTNAPKSRGVGRILSSIPPAEALSAVHAQVLGLYGGSDARVDATIPPADSALRAQGKTHTPTLFEGAGHGFLRQQNGMNGANLKATQAAGRQPFHGSSATWTRQVDPKGFLPRRFCSRLCLGVYAMLHGVERQRSKPARSTTVRSPSAFFNVPTAAAFCIALGATGYLLVTRTSLGIFPFC